MYVGLFSLKVDKIGITAEVGGYVQLWGYFYYHKTWQEKLGAASNSSGAMRIEIGIYIEIKFVAQAFSSSKLTYNPTLYAHQWPLWSAGQVDNIYAFANTDNTGYTFKTVKTLALPSKHVSDAGYGPQNRQIEGPEPGRCRGEQFPHRLYQPGVQL